MRIAALLVADDGHGRPAEEAESGDDRRVVGELAVAVELDEIGRQGSDVVEGVRPGRVAGHERLLPGRQAGVNLAGNLLQLFAQPLELPAVRRVIGKRRELLDAPLELQNRFFEIAVLVHGADCTGVN